MSCEDNEKAAICKQKSTLPDDLDLGLLASGIVRNKFLLFKPPGLWYFVTTAQAD